MPTGRQHELERIILAGLPGSDFSYDKTTFLELFKDYADMEAEDLRQSLIDFLREVVPIAEEAGIRLAIHPDDPPIPLFGLPRIVSTAADAAAILDALDSRSNGLTFCVGSYGVARRQRSARHDRGVRAAHQFHASPQRQARDGARHSTRPSISTATATWWRLLPQSSPRSGAALRGPPTGRSRCGPTMATCSPPIR